MTSQTIAPPEPAISAGAAPADRSTVSAGLRHALVLAKRSLVKTWRTPEALIDVTLQPVIFLLLFTYLVGGAIGAGDRGAYLQFLLPGLLAQSLALGGIALGQNLNADIEKGVFDRFRSLPIARLVPLAGAVMADFFRYLILCVMFTGFGYVIGFRIGTNLFALLAAIGIAIAFALCFAWVSVWVGMKARTSGSVQGIMFLMIFPLSFGSSTFVPLDSMPGWLQAFSKVNPITQIVDVVRGLMVSGPVASHLLWTAVWGVGLLAVFVPLAMRAYKRRV
jgi:oleandomycin transport system permease protein